MPRPDPEEFESRLDALKSEAREKGVVSEKGAMIHGSPIPAGTGVHSKVAPGYYGLPAVKPPVWTWEIPCYFFVGGLAGMSGLIAIIALIAGQYQITHAATLVAAIAGGIMSPILLILDLGRPKRFLNMLRVFKHQSPMSVGAWILTCFGMFAIPAAILSELFVMHVAAGNGVETAIKILLTIALIGTAIFGLLLATYTGVLLGVSVIPFWYKHRRLLPLHFGFVGLGSAAGFLIAIGYTQNALRIILITASAVEVLLWFYLEFRRLKRIDDPLHHGRSAWLLKIGEFLTGPIALVLILLSYPRVGAVIFLCGALINRFGWIEGGKESGRDPEAVFVGRADAKL